MHLKDYLISFAVLGLCCNNDISETLVSVCKRCPRSGFSVAAIISRTAPDVSESALLHIVPHLRWTSDVVRGAQCFGTLDGHPKNPCSS